MHRLVATALLALGALTLQAQTPATTAPAAATPGFGPANPFYAPSTLPFQAPAFDKIKDSDFQPAIDAGMAQHLSEIEQIANNPAPPTFENTLVAMERSGQLLTRVLMVFGSLTSANTNPTLQQVQRIEAPRLAAHNDAINLNAKLFARIKTLYDQRATLKLDPESLRLLEVEYRRFVKAGANLNESDKAKLRKLNEEQAALSNAFNTKLLAATKAAAFQTTDRAALAGLSDAQIDAAAQSAKARGTDGYLIPLQNTTQQPDLDSLTNRATREAILKASLNRTERSDDNDTRATLARLAQVRAEKAHLLGFPSFAAWNLQDQMAKTPEAAVNFMDALVPPATARAGREAADIQAVIDSQHGNFQLEPWDWEFYSEQVRKAKYDLDAKEIRPYFELNRVLQDGVFYAAHQLYGLTFTERHDLPVYQPDVRVFTVTDSNGKPLALFYCDYFKRDNKNGGAWMNELVGQSRLLGTLPIVANTANLPKPAPGQPALLDFDGVITMFHEFGHALHGMFSDAQYPTLSGTGVPRDFVEFPSQFNEHWATEPSVFAHFARHYQTGAPMPAELVARIKKAATFNQGYALTELVAAAELDMQWHLQPAGAPLADVDAFETAALERKHLALRTVPPRYRSSYFQHIWGSGYAAGYYAYLWSEMLDDAAYDWFEHNGGLTRANGDRFRKMVLSRGNTADLETTYEQWLGGPPSAAPMARYRGLVDPAK